MTTDIKVTSTMNVTKENETYNIRKYNCTENTTIAAGSWLLSSEDHHKARVAVLRLLFNLKVSRLAKFRIWYFVGDSAWQDDTRIIRHKKLWERLRARGIEVTHSKEFKEDVLERNGKLRFFGATMISELSIESVVRAIDIQNCSYIIVLPNSTDINAALCHGWNNHNGFDENLLQYVIKCDGMIFKAIGEFDDPESGFVGLGKPELVERLVQF